MANGKNFAASAQGASCADVQSTKQTESILNLSNREIAKSFCKVQNFAYICIGKCDIQSTRSVFIPQYSGVPEVVLCTSRLPKHKGAPLFLYPYIN